MLLPQRPSYPHTPLRAPAERIQTRREALLLREAILLTETILLRETIFLREALLLTRQVQGIVVSQVLKLLRGLMVGETRLVPGPRRLPRLELP